MKHLTIIILCLVCFGCRKGEEYVFDESPYVSSPDDIKKYTKDNPSVVCYAVSIDYCRKEYPKSLGKKYSYGNIEYDFPETICFSTVHCTDDKVFKEKS